MIVKNYKNTITAQPFSTTLLKGISLIILIFTSTENIYAQTTSIKQFGVDLIAEPFPNIVLLRTIEVEKKPILFYLIVSKNLYFRYKGKLITIKLFSREISYRASYNYIFAENEIIRQLSAIWVNDFNLQYLTLTHDHVYDLLSINYGWKYKVKGSSIKRYTHVNIGFSINFPGEFYYKYLWIHPINLKKACGLFKCVFTGSDIHSFTEYNQYFRLKQIVNDGTGTKSYYSVVFNSTSTSQWVINILLGLIENIFVEYAIEIPVCSFLTIYTIHIHISIGTILGTIEWLYRYFKEENGSGFLRYFYALLSLQSLYVFKIGYYE